MAGNLLAQLTRRRGINPAIGGRSGPRDVSGFLPLNMKRRDLGRLTLADKLRRGRGKQGLPTSYKPRLSTLMNRLRFGKRKPVTEDLFSR